MSWVEEAFQIPVEGQRTPDGEHIAPPAVEQLPAAAAAAAAAEPVVRPPAPTVAPLPVDAPWAKLVVSGLDGSQTSIEVRLAMTGMEAALAVGSLLGVTKREEFGLAFPAKKGWLDEDQSLADQGVLAGDALIFKKKYFIADEELSRADEADVRLLYPQCVDGLVSGFFFRCDKGHVIGLAALEARVFQAQHNQRMPTIQELTEFLPLEHRDGATVKCVIDQVEGMSLMSGMDAMFQFVHICSSLDGYGITWYVVSDTLARRTPAGLLEKVPVLLGIGRNGVYRSNYKTKETIEHYPLSAIEQWGGSKEAFVFDFGAANREAHWGIATKSGRKIAQILQGYMRLLRVRGEELARRKEERLSRPASAAAAGNGFVMLK